MAQTAIGVLWDLNTCPVPDGMDPRVVRGSIISALQKFVGVPCRVTIFAVGNLDNVAPYILKGICSSGISIRHIIVGMMDVDGVLSELCEMETRLEKLLIISGDTSWHFPDRVHLTFLRAHPKDVKHVWVWENYQHKWVWENLLTEYSRDVLRKRRRIGNVKSDLSCTVCERQFSSKSCDDFIKHLKTDEEHKENTRDSVFTDENGRPYLFCEACDYPGYNDYYMTIHLESSEHKDSLTKTCPSCMFCGFKSNDMACHYNSDEHTQKEISFVLADACSRKSEAIEKEEDAVRRSLTTRQGMSMRARNAFEYSGKDPLVNDGLACADLCQAAEVTTALPSPSELEVGNYYVDFSSHAITAMAYANRMIGQYESKLKEKLKVSEALVAVKDLEIKNKELEGERRNDEVDRLNMSPDQLRLDPLAPLPRPDDAPVGGDEHGSNDAFIASQMEGASQPGSQVGFELPKDP